MNYEQFLEQMKEDLQARFAEDLPPEYADVRIGIRDVEKLQGESYRGLSFRSGDSPIEANLNMTGVFQAYEAGRPYEDILEEVEAQLMKVVDRTPNFDIGELTDYEALKPKLMMELIPQKGNEDRLENIPHQNVEDMALISSSISRMLSSVDASTAVLPEMMPALAFTTCWATSKTAMVMLKVFVISRTATKVLKIHLKKIQVSNLVTNAETILSYDPLLRGAIRYNELTQRVDVVKPLGWERGSSGLDDNDVNNIHLYCERTYGITSQKLIEEVVHIVANRNRFHPVRDFLNSLEWDGQPRVRYALRHFLGADDSDYTYEVLKFFMLGAISRVFKPGIKFDYIICVVGDQGAGKSTFFRLLAVDDDWFTDDLKDLESGKVYEKLQGHWIIEMSEMLAIKNARSNEAIKSFLSRQKEIYRTPYERYPKDRPRQCVFAGTTNKISFLPSDRTGNRRFLPIACQESEAEVFILDDEKASREYIRQMWAEVMEIWRSGKVRLKLSPEIEAEVRQRQRQFMQEDVDSGLILAFMQEYSGDMVCSKQLFREALHNEFAQPQRWQTNEINDIVNQLIRDGTLTGWRYFDSPRRFTGTDYGTQKGWEKVTETGPDRNEVVSTNDGFRQMGMDEYTPF